MITKLVEIKNFGTFQNFKGSKTDWKGNFNKNNIIYAPNGTGKTSLSLIFQSLEKNDIDIIIKKRRLHSSEDPIIRLLFDEYNTSTDISFDNRTWNKKYSDIHVFNSFYLSDNIYTFTTSDAFLELLYLDSSMKEDKEILNEKLKVVHNKRRAVKNNKSWINHYTKYSNVKGNKQKLQRAIKKNKLLNSQIDSLSNEISDLKKPIQNKFKDISITYCEEINNILRQFTDKIIINQVKPIFNNKCNLQNVIFSLTVDGIETDIMDRNETSFNFILSDGDKSAIAFASFISHLKLLPTISNKIVLIDDPFTSFDSNRRQKTIDLISMLAVDVRQLFVLTHDLDFGARLSERIYPKNTLLTLELFIDKSESNIKMIDLNKEMLTGLIKNITLLHDFIENGGSSQSDLQNIKRHIRLSLEGIFRIKYFEFNGKNIWLGDFLKFIEQSESDEKYKKFEKLLPYLQKLRNINHYSSPSHHDQSYRGSSTMVNPVELRSYIQDTIDMINII